uniref:Uncharacterized protein n=1 Tax=Ascaris lumbricoides TaxID=6252 RepID=A0A0M3IA28_ASCLU
MPSSLAEGHPECLEVFSRSTPLHLSPCDNCSRVAELQIEDNTEDAEDSRFICPHRRGIILYHIDAKREVETVKTENLDEFMEADHPTHSSESWIVAFERNRAMTTGIPT